MAGDWAVGDSIGTGFARFGGAAGRWATSADDLDADSAVGRTPKQVLDFITSRPKGYWKDKSIILSTGVSNRPAEAGLVDRQVKALLKDGEAKRVRVVGVGDRAGYEGGKFYNLAPYNEKIGKAAESAGGEFMGALPAVVHPAPQYYHGRIQPEPNAPGPRSDAADPRSRAVEFWMNAGAPRHVAEGIADRIGAESGFRSAAWNPDDKGAPSGGLYQHHLDRLARLKNFAEQQGKPWTDPDVQHRFALAEVQGGDPVAAKHWQDILSAPDQQTAATLWDRYFERSAGGVGGGGGGLGMALARSGVPGGGVDASAADDLEFPSPTGSTLASALARRAPAAAPALPVQVADAQPQAATTTPSAPVSAPLHPLQLNPAAAAQVPNLQAVFQSALGHILRGSNNPLAKLLG